MQPTENGHITPTKAGPLSVTITVNGGISQVRPACTDVLAPVLSYEEFRFGANADGRLAHSVASKVAYKQVGDHLEIVTGCIQRVIQRLTQAGHEVTVNDLRNCSHDPVQINPSVLTDAEAIAPGLAEVLRDHRQGVLGCKDRRKADIVGGLCLLFRPAPIFIACKTNEAAQSMAAGLGHYLGGGVEAVHGLNWTSSCRVVCGTFQSLNRSNPTDWKVLVFADAREGTQGKYGKSDNIRNAFSRLTSKVGLTKPLKSLKKTSSSKLRDNEQFNGLEDLFLGHAPQKMSDKHYTTAPQKLLDSAIRWLASEYGLASPS